MVICSEQNCGKKAMYGTVKRQPLYCSVHRQEGTVDVITNLCKDSDCLGRAIYGYSGTKKAFYCGKHKLPEMVNVRSKKCEFLGCLSQASYNFPDNKKVKFCYTHKLKGMMNVKSKNCEHKDCTKRASFALVGDSAKFCKNHKLPGMINVRNEECEFDGCKKTPNYNLPGKKRGRFCVSHKSSDMVDVHHKECEHLGCKTTPTFNFFGEKSARFCDEHKHQGMVNVTHARCKREGCELRPSFGFPEQKGVAYCDEHKLSGMINKMNKTCEHQNCKKFPSYNFTEEKTPRFCTHHKLSNMVDIVSKKCQNHDCGKIATFGKLFETKTHCGEHRLNNEFNRNKPTCSQCSEYAVCTDKGNGYPIRCESHRNKKDINVVHKKCEKCHLDDFIASDQTMCNNCRDFYVKKVQHIKEDKIKNLLDVNKIKYEFHDKIIPDSCNYYRPDIVIDKGAFYIIVEVDENQHESYARECETMRMINIQQGFGGVPVIFIRFNPDPYVDSKGVLNKSYRGREKKLLQVLKDICNYEIIEEMLSIIYLYYDGYENVERLKVDFENYCVITA